MIGRAGLAVVLALLVAGASATPSASPLISAGRPVTGTPSRVDAPLVEEGVWLDRLGGAGTDDGVHYYRLQRQRTDSSLHVSVTTPLGSESDELDVAVLDAAGDVCADDPGTGYGSSSDQVLIAASVLVPESLDASDAACAARGTYVVQVRHGSQTFGRRADVPVELRIREEPPVRDVGDLPATLPTPGWRTPAFTPDAPEVRGGDALASARVLVPGTVAGRIGSGDSQVFAVDLDYGQSLAAAARLSVPESLGERLDEGGAPVLAVQVLSPSRRDAAGGDEFAPDTTTTLVRGYGRVDGDADGKTVVEFTDTVNYRNRYGTSDSLAASGERGRYLVVLSLVDRDGDGRRVTVPFDLALAVRGSVQAVPDYTADDATAVDDGQTGDGASTRRVVGGVVVALGALAAVGGAVLLSVVLRRRRRPA